MYNSQIKNLLVLEDEAVIGSICCRVLAQEGYNVVLSNDGNKAAELLGEYDFDLFLLDVKTPGITGLELYEIICRNSPHLSSKVIFMTAYSFTKNIPESVNGTGCQLLEKPFTADELIRAVRSV